MYCDTKMSRSNPNSTSVVAVAAYTPLRAFPSQFKLCTLGHSVEKSLTFYGKRPCASRVPKFQ